MKAITFSGVVATENVIEGWVSEEKWLELMAIYS